MSNFKRYFEIKDIYIEEHEENPIVKNLWDYANKKLRKIIIDKEYQNLVSFRIQTHLFGAIYEIIHDTYEKKKNKYKGITPYFEGEVMRGMYKEDLESGTINKKQYDEIKKVYKDSFDNLHDHLMSWLEGYMSRRKHFNNYKNNRTMAITHNQETQNVFKSMMRTSFVKKREKNILEKARHLLKKRVNEEYVPFAFNDLKGTLYSMASEIIFRRITSGIDEIDVEEIVDEELASISSGYEHEIKEGNISRNEYIAINEASEKALFEYSEVVSEYLSI